MGELPVTRTEQQPDYGNLLESRKAGVRAIVLLLDQSGEADRLAITDGNRAGHRRCEIVGDVCWDWAVPTFLALLTSSDMSSRTRPLAFTRGVTLRMMPVSR